MSSISGRHAPGAPAAFPPERERKSESKEARQGSAEPGAVVRLTDAAMADHKSRTLGPVPSYTQTHASARSAERHGQDLLPPDEKAAARLRRDHKPAEPDGDIQAELADHRVREGRLRDLAVQAARLDAAQGREMGEALGRACPADAWPKLVWSLIAGQASLWHAVHQPFLEGVFQGWLNRQGHHPDGAAGAALNLVDTVFRYLTYPVTGRADPSAHVQPDALPGPQVPVLEALAKTALAHAGKEGADLLLRRFIPYARPGSPQDRGLRPEARDDRCLGAIAGAAQSPAQRGALPRWLMERAQFRGLNGFAWMAGPLLRRGSEAGQGVAAALVNLKDLSALDHGAAMLLDAAQEWPSCKDRDVIRALRNCSAQQLASWVAAMAATPVHPMRVVRGLLGLREAFAVVRDSDDDASADASLRDLLDKAIKEVLQRAAAQASPAELIEVGYRYALSQPRPMWDFDPVDGRSRPTQPKVPLEDKPAAALVHRLYPQAAKDTGAAKPEQKHGSRTAERTEGQVIQDWLYAGMRMRDLCPSQAWAVSGLSSADRLELVRRGDWARVPGPDESSTDKRRLDDSGPKAVCAFIQEVRALSAPPRGVGTVDAKSRPTASPMGLDESEGTGPRLDWQEGLALIDIILEQNLRHQDGSVLAAAREAMVGIVADASRGPAATERKGEHATGDSAKVALIVDHLNRLYTRYLTALGIDETCLGRPALRSWERQGAQRWVKDVEAEVGQIRKNYKATHDGDVIPAVAAFGEKMANHAAQLRAKLAAMPTPARNPEGQPPMPAVAETKGGPAHEPEPWTLQQVYRILPTCDLGTLTGMQKAVVAIFKLFEDQPGGMPSVAGRELAKQCGPGRHEELIWVLKHQENDEPGINTRMGLMLEGAYAQMLAQSQHPDGVTGAAGVLAQILFRTGGGTDGFFSHQRRTAHLDALADAAMAAIPAGELAHFLDMYFVLPRDAHPSDLRHGEDGANLFGTLGTSLMPNYGLSEDRRQALAAWLELQAQRMTPIEFGWLADAPRIWGEVARIASTISARHLGTALLRAVFPGSGGSAYDDSIDLWLGGVEALLRYARSDYTDEADAQKAESFNRVTCALGLSGLWLHAREHIWRTAPIKPFHAFQSLRQCVDQAIGAVVPFVDPPVLVEAGYLRARAESQPLTKAQAEEWIHDVCQALESVEPASDDQGPPVHSVEAIKTYLRAGLALGDLGPLQVLGLEGLTHPQRMKLFSRGDWVRATSPEQVIERIAEIGALEASADVLADMVAVVLNMNRPRLSRAVMEAATRQLMALMNSEIAAEGYIDDEFTSQVLASLEQVIELASWVAGVQRVLERDPPQVHSWEVEGVRDYIAAIPAQIEALAADPVTAPLTAPLRARLQTTLEAVQKALGPVG